VKQTVENVKSCFLDIKSILGSGADAGNFDDAAFVDRLGEAVSATYVVLNDGMCEEMEMCHSCAENRDKLHDVMVLLEELGSGSVADATAKARLDAFESDVDSVLERIDTVLATL